ncbi:MAG TPA: penicillin acylase family protein, partial [Chitinophagaceae bacterium]|nr:penicillin acylase family protein [Chitinophagaceae bacterium]
MTNVHAVSITKTTKLMYFTRYCSSPSREFIKRFVSVFLLAPLIVWGQKLPSGELARWQAAASRTTILRDNWGIPHIYGQTDADAVFGLMYAQCEDNFPGIERNYLYQMGKQAEVDGAEMIYQDIQLQLIADTAEAIKEYQAADPSFRKLLDAFADGINYFLYKNPEVKPLVLRRFEPWFPLMFTDGSVSATVTGGINLGETEQFYSSDPEKSLTTNHRSRQPQALMSERETGSNGFAVAPAKSVSGNALLYINPHVPFYFRDEVHMVSQEGLNAYGAVTWGQFFIYQGFNEHCGWMHTSSNADVGDLYEEKVSKKGDQWFYEYDGKQRPVLTKKLRIGYVQGNTRLQKEFTGYLTHHGPVLGSRNGKWLSLRANNRSYDALLESWQITKANTFSEYKKAMDLLSNATNNTVYADDQGNIAFWYGNFMPKRDPRLDWTKPVDGSKAGTEWKGLHPLNEIVHVYNPSTGWIQNCNATPFTSSGKASPEKKKYPVYMAPDGQNFRSVHAIRLFEQSGKFTLDDLVKTGYSRYLAAFDVLLPSLFAAYSGAADTIRQHLAEPMQLLQQWDRISAVNSIATTLAIEWGTRMLAGMPRPSSSEEATFQTERVAFLVKKTSSRQQLSYLLEALQSLNARFGTWKTAWGEINRYQRSSDGVFRDDQPSLPVAQTASTFGQLPSFVSAAQNTKKRYGYSGNSFIAAVEFGPRLKAKSI